MSRACVIAVGLSALAAGLTGCGQTAAPTNQQLASETAGPARPVTDDERWRELGLTPPPKRPTAAEMDRWSQAMRQHRSALLDGYRGPAPECPYTKELEDWDIRFNAADSADREARGLPAEGAIPPKPKPKPPTAAELERMMPPPSWRKFHEENAGPSFEAMEATLAVEIAKAKAAEAAAAPARTPVFQYAVWVAGAAALAVVVYRRRAAALVLAVALMLPGYGAAQALPDGFVRNEVRLKRQLGRELTAVEYQRCREADAKEVAALRGEQPKGMPKEPCPGDFAGAYPAAGRAHARCSPEKAWRLVCAHRNGVVRALPAPSQFVELVAEHGDPVCKYVLDNLPLWKNDPAAWDAFAREPEAYCRANAPPPKAPSALTPLPGEVETEIVRDANAVRWAPPAAGAGGGFKVSDVPLWGWVGGGLAVVLWLRSRKNQPEPD